MSTDSPMIALASSSPRRRALLSQIGVRFDTVEVAVDERPGDGEDVRDLAVRLALAKARAGRDQVGVDGRPVLGADTVVSIDGEPFGKPRDRDDARRMLRRLGGREHEVISAVALVQRDTERTRCQVSLVRMLPLEDPVIDAYWSTGEPRGKAGAYAIQGLGACFISHIQGSYSGVMGLPLFETVGLLMEAGVAGDDGLKGLLRAGETAAEGAGPA